MASPPRQLALSLDHAERLTREDFLPGASNEAALAMIERWPDWPSRALAIAGPEGSGKSHLAAIWADRAGARIVSAETMDTDSLPEALATGALVVENCVPGGFDERALFHLLNLVREQSAALLITAKGVPSSWAVTLPDLASRLRALPTVSMAVLAHPHRDRELAGGRRGAGQLSPDTRWAVLCRDQDRGSDARPRGVAAQKAGQSCARRRVIPGFPALTMPANLLSCVTG